MPTSAVYLTSIMLRGMMYKTESTHKWQYLSPDDDPATYNPTEDDYACIVDAFETPLSSPRALLDDFTLQMDGGIRIAAGIRDRTAGAFSNGSYDPDILEGSTSSMMAAM